jgi:hypothetical protein
MKEKFIFFGRVKEMKERKLLKVASERIESQICWKDAQFNNILP